MYDVCYGVSEKGDAVPATHEGTEERNCRNPYKLVM
jgi:hypothetical protein